MQTKGRRRPFDTTTSSKRRRMCRFTRCRQIQLSRMSTAKTVAAARCTASRAAFTGNAPVVIKSSASALTSLVIASLRNPANAANRSLACVASPSDASSSTLLRHHTHVMSAQLPPISRGLLFGGHDNIPARISHKITDDRCLNINNFHISERQCHATS